MNVVDVAVVGAGPAGLAAATEAARAGARVALITEYPALGGQFFKRPPAAWVSGGELDPSQARGARFGSDLARLDVEVMTETLVWGIFDNRDVMLFRGGQSEVLAASAIVLATGAYDRPVPFPGWTLPGVISAGAAQTMLKEQYLRPGGQVLLVGAGPFLLPVAEQLAKAKVDIAAVVEPGSLWSWARLGPRFWGQWGTFADALHYLGALRRSRVPVLLRHRIVSVEGDGQVERAVVCRVDSDWNAIPGTNRTIESDTVAVGYGFLPSTEIAESCGCSLRWDGRSHAFFVECDEFMRTSQPGIYAAGEITGVAGSDVAEAEGRLAGLTAAHSVGRVSSGELDRRSRPIRRQIRRRSRFADALAATYAPRPGLWQGVSDDVVVCRCEEVRAGEVRERVGSGCTSPKEIKDWTRAGMGLCQGRMCSAVVARLISQETGVPVESLPRSTVRPPIKPVPAGVLATSELP